MGKAKIVCIVGPTAVGKTGLAIELALELGGEVISADSMQIYKGMDIGTAKPSAAEMRGVPHHMLDVVHPNEDYSAARMPRRSGVCAYHFTGSYNSRRRVGAVLARCFRRHLCAKSGEQRNKT